MHSTISGSISAEAHHFCRAKVKGDGNCLFASVLIGFQQHLTTNKDLRESVANCILNSPELHGLIMAADSAGCETIEEYCDKLELDGEIWGGEFELGILSKLFNILICVISMAYRNGKKRVWRRYYGEDYPLGRKCVYIFYQELDYTNNKGHYEPLCLMNKRNPEEKETMFNPNDDTVNECLRKFIKEKLKFNRYIELGVDIPVDVNEVSRPHDGSNEIGMVSDLILEESSMKRKAAVDGILPPPNDGKKVPITSSGQCGNPNKRMKVAIAASDTNSDLNNNDTDSMEIENLLRTDMFKDITDTPVIQETIVEQPTAANNEHQEEKINSEKEPVKQSDDQTQNSNQLNYTMNHHYN